MGVVDFFLAIIAPTPRVRESNHRFLPSIALFATVVAFILSLLVLLAGKESEFRKSEDIAIVRFNVSYLGYNLSDYPGSLAADIASVTPRSPVPNPSVTRYMGIADWYSVHYLAVCRGYWLADSAAPVLTATRTNYTCTSRGAGHSFSLLDTLKSEINPKVQGLIAYVDDIPVVGTTTACNALILGLVLTVVNALILSTLCLYGRHHWNLTAFIISMVAFVSFTISSSKATADAETDKSNSTRTAVMLSSKFLGLTWTTMGCASVAMVCELVEWIFELQTPRGVQITLGQSDRSSSAGRWKDWKPKKIRLMRERKAARDAEAQQAARAEQHAAQEAGDSGVTESANPHVSNEK